ncbi:MAG: hypothetical protein ACTSSG_09345 [Candidatus Heimdallarchaeaceae archaeon]
MSEDSRELEKRMAELEEKINYVILQINNLQHKVTDSNPELEKLMGILNILTSSLQISKAPFSMINRTLSMKDKILEKHPSLKYDDISKNIVAVLERKGNLNISQLTEALRKERGSASRRIVRERVNKLIEKGIVREIGEGYGRQIELIPLEDED